MPKARCDAGSCRERCCRAIGVIRGKEGELVDCTAPPADAPRLETFPAYFDTGILARQDAGYISEAQSQRLARELQALHPGSEVVPIGPRPRGWVVVQRQGKRR